MLGNLRVALQVRRLRQFELAGILKISASVLSEIISGRREATLEIRRRAASVLEMDEGWLFRPIVPPRAEGKAVGAEAATAS